jgi:hypothetical protein
VAALGGEDPAFGQGVRQQLVVAGKAVAEAEAKVQLGQALGFLRLQVLLEPGPQLAIDFLVALAPLRISAPRTRRPR